MKALSQVIKWFVTQNAPGLNVRVAFKVKLSQKYFFWSSSFLGLLCKLIELFQRSVLSVVFCQNVACICYYNCQKSIGKLEIYNLNLQTSNIFLPFLKNQFYREVNYSEFCFPINIFHIALLKNHLFKYVSMLNMLTTFNVVWVS